MNDQAKPLRKLMWEQKRKSIYISVSSGKGGVGKSNFVVNLAYILSQMRKKVLVFDADISLANVDVLLNLNVKNNIRDYLFGKVDFTEIIAKNIFGFDVIPASSGFSDLSELSNEQIDKIIDIFIDLDKTYDYIIFDTGAGITDIVIKFASLADYFVVVTQPEPAAITDAYALIKVVNHEENVDSAYLVLNRVKSAGRDVKVYENLKRIINKFLNVNLEYLGTIREDKDIDKAIIGQKLICESMPKTKYSRDLLSIANKIAGERKVSKRFNFYNFFKGKRVNG
ncbi:MAG: MinD/ParA family protein [Deferribacterota bacterium]|nr:MinD/ParA family protein [Deferribacterota bacterium]